MKKTDKKIENTLRESLTEVCEVALHEVAGFKWLTHLVNYSDFPRSLIVVCVFDTNSDLSRALQAEQDNYLCLLINKQLTASGIVLKDVKSHVRFDTEEACEQEHAGRWNKRLV